jgi:biopolymer transport protein ExbD
VGAKIGGDDEGPVADINITPFVDVMLVVLIIFMVTTPIIMKPSINVNLPKSVSGEQSTPTQLNIAISAKGEIQLNGSSTDESQLTAKVQEILVKNPDAQAVIAADKDVPHGKVVGVIDAIKTGGVTKFAISIDKKSK